MERIGQRIRMLFAGSRGRPEWFSGRVVSFNDATGDRSVVFDSCDDVYEYDLAREEASKSKLHLETPDEAVAAAAAREATARSKAAAAEKADAARAVATARRAARAAAMAAAVAPASDDDESDGDHDFAVGPHRPGEVLVKATVLSETRKLCGAAEKLQLDPAALKRLLAIGKVALRPGTPAEGAQAARVMRQLICKLQLDARAVEDMVRDAAGKRTAMTRCVRAPFFSCASRRAGACA